MMMKAVAVGVTLLVTGAVGVSVVLAPETYPKTSVIVAIKATIFTILDLIMVDLLRGWIFIEQIWSIWVSKQSESPYNLSKIFTALN